MSEKEMKDLIWLYPERFFSEDLRRLKRENSSGAGRIDLLFTDQQGAIVVIEAKRGSLPRAAAVQLEDYYGAARKAFPNAQIRLIAIANYIPEERGISFQERHHIQSIEVREDVLRQIARDVGYIFASEELTPVNSMGKQLTRDQIAALVLQRNRGVWMSEPHVKSHMRDLGCYARSYYEALGRLVTQQLAEVTFRGNMKVFRWREKARVDRLTGKRS